MGIGTGLGIDDDRSKKRYTIGEVRSLVLLGVVLGVLITIATRGMW